MEKDIRIVIVDDNRDFCSVLEEYLKGYDENFKVVGVAYDGLEGIDLIKEEKPDLVISDIVMPQIDGLDMLEVLNREKMLNETKVVMLSALNKENIIQRAMALGAEYYVVKPFDYEVFSRKIKKMFEEPKIIETHSVVLDYVNERNMESLEVQISNLINRIGVPPHIRGHLYIRKAINMVLDDVGVLNGITKELYPGIAKEFGTTSSRVERAIRHAIETAWIRGNKDFIERIFGKNNVYSKPTNSNFIACVAEKIRLENAM